MIYFHCAAVRQSMVRIRVSILGLLGMAWVISACAESPSHLNTTYLDRYADPNPTLASVLECHGFSCSETSRATLNRDAWRQVAAVYVPRAKDARTERRQIAHGVALIQLLVGQQTGTATHQWTHRDKYIFSNLNDPTQLDCIDEAVNTWTYLTLMERNGLLHFHRVAKLSHAGTPIDPRNTAVLQEIGGQYFAIDPSLVDVGVPPPIIPLDSWIAQWPPDLPANEAPVRLRASPKLAAASNNGL
jgi:hypothetical protein